MLSKKIRLNSPQWSSLFALEVMVEEASLLWSFIMISVHKGTRHMITDECAILAHVKVSARRQRSMTRWAVCSTLDFSWSVRWSLSQPAWKGRRRRRRWIVYCNWNDFAKEFWEDFGAHISTVLLAGARNQVWIIIQIDVLQMWQAGNCYAKVSNHHKKLIAE